MKVLTNYSYLMEDIFLYHVLSDVAEKDIFYIDVGANDPVNESVTCLFYNMGGAWN